MNPFVGAVVEAVAEAVAEVVVVAVVMEVAVTEVDTEIMEMEKSTLHPISFSKSLNDHPFSQ